MKIILLFSLLFSFISFSSVFAQTEEEKKIEKLFDALLYEIAKQAALNMISNDEKKELEKSFQSLQGEKNYDSVLEIVSKKTKIKSELEKAKKDILDSLNVTKLVDGKDIKKDVEIINIIANKLNLNNSSTDFDLKNKIEKAENEAKNISNNGGIILPDWLNICVLRDICIILILVRILFALREIKNMLSSSKDFKTTTSAHTAKKSPNHEVKDSEINEHKREKEKLQKPKEDLYKPNEKSQNQQEGEVEKNPITEKGAGLDSPKKLKCKLFAYNPNSKEKSAFIDNKLSKEKGDRVYKFVVFEDNTADVSLSENPEAHKTAFSNIDVYLPDSIIQKSGNLRNPKSYRQKNKVTARLIDEVWVLDNNFEVEFE